jgi:hypothetical protein
MRLNSKRCSTSTKGATTQQTREEGRPLAATQWVLIIKAVALEGRSESISSELHGNMTKPIGISNLDVE